MGSSALLTQGWGSWGPPCPCSRGPQPWGEHTLGGRGVEKALRTRKEHQPSWPGSFGGPAGDSTCSGSPGSAPGGSPVGFTKPSRTSHGDNPTSLPARLTRMPLHQLTGGIRTGAGRPPDGRCHFPQPTCIPVGSRVPEPIGDIFPTLQVPRGQTQVAGGSTVGCLRTPSPRGHLPGSELLVWVHSPQQLGSLCQVAENHWGHCLGAHGGALQ